MMTCCRNEKPKTVYEIADVRFGEAQHIGATGEVVYKTADRLTASPPAADMPPCPSCRR
jgi:hypothetical protein